jgi:hypothetical protein
VSEKRFYRLNSKTARAMAVAHVEAAPDGYTVEIKAPNRSDEHSRLMHSMAHDLSKQVPWCDQTLSVEQWKRFATAKLKKDKIVFDCNDKGEPDANAGLVILGMSTRDKGAKEINEIVAWFEWMGAMHDVRWSHEEAKVAQLEEMRR